MTLKITPDEIQIRNSAGQVKFTNKHRLLYLIDQAQGDLTVLPGMTTSMAPWTGAEVFDYNYRNIPKFALITVKFLGGPGAVIQNSLLNKEIQLNGNMTVYFNGYQDGTSAVADSQILSADYLAGWLYFSHTGFLSNAQVTGSLIDMSFRWKIIVVGYKL